MSMRHVAQRIPFTPTVTQRALLEQCFGARRFVYNSQVEIFNTYNKATNPNLVYPNITVLKQANTWLANNPIPSNALSNTILDFRKSRSAYFHKAQYGKHRPKFASRHDNVQSFRNTMPIRTMQGNRYMLSRKLGSIRIQKRHHPRYPLRQLMSWTVKRENNKYYLILLFMVDIQPLEPVNNMVGIDTGVKDTLILSTGTKLNMPDRIQELEQRVKQEQRKLARRRKGIGQQSNNYYKQKLRVAQAYAKLRHYRENWQHQVSHTLIEENQFISMETLNIAGLLRNTCKPAHKKTRGVKQRQHTMHHSIHQAAWRGLQDKIMSKASMYGRDCVQVGRFYPSSKLCSNCGFKNMHLTLNMRQWDCPQCGSHHDRDVNAAINILQEGFESPPYRYCLNRPTIGDSLLNIVTSGIT